MSNSLVDLINVRELEVNDINFILDSSIQCLRRYTESITKGMTKADAIDWLETYILYALQRLNYSVFIACEKDDSNSIVGYIIADTTKNHIFLQYTKYAFRQLGIQKNVLLPLVIDPNKPITCNWPTKQSLQMADKGKLRIARITELDMIQQLEINYQESKGK